MTWPPCMLPFLVFIVIRGLFRSNRGEDTGQGIEMQSQETRRLVDDFDGDNEDVQGKEEIPGADRPPADDEAVHRTF